MAKRRKQNPKIKMKDVTASEALSNRAVRHQFFLDQFATGEARRIVTFLNDKVIPDVTAQIQRHLGRVKSGTRLSVETTKRLSEVGAASNEIIQGSFKDINNVFTERMKEFGLAEGAFAQQSMAAQLRKFGVDVRGASPVMLQSAITSQPMRGRFLRRWWSDLSSKTQTELLQELRVGLVQGEELSSLVKRWTDKSTVTKRHATALIRTAVNHVSSHARELTYAANRDVVKGVQIVATLDAKTTDICRSLDGQVFPVAKGPRPPFHILCRTTTTPVLKSWKELGIDLNEAPAGTRAALGGEVPATFKYGDWLRIQPLSIQQEALGPTRANLFRSGQISDVRNFTNTRGKRLTLDQLRRKEGLTKSSVKVVTRN